MIIRPPRATRLRLSLGLLLLAIASLAACTAHPLGEDWEALDPAARTARSLEALEQVLSGGVDGTGREFSDRDVRSVDRRGVTYVAQDDRQARPSRLSWSAIRSVEAQPLTTLPSRPETLYLYLDEPQSRGVLDKITPALAHAGLAQPYLLLPSRPRWSRSRVILALQHLRRADIAPVGSEAEPAPPPEPEREVQSEVEVEGAAPREVPDLAPAAPGASKPRKLSADEVEAKLEKLSEWRRRGLITQEDFDAKCREVLANY